MISDEEIKKLFAFCQKHFVHHYDLQVELVDHLANAIEAEMASNPASSFEHALEKVYAGFGVTGFARIVNSRSSAMSARYRRERKKIFWSYFTWPRIAGTLCAFSILMLAALFVKSWSLVIISNILMVGVYLYEMLVIGRLTRLVKGQVKPLLLTQTIREQSWFGSVIAFFLLPHIFTFDKDMSEKSIQLTYLMQVIISIGFFLASLAYRSVGTAAIDDAKRDFPEAFAQ